MLHPNTLDCLQQLTNKTKAQDVFFSRDYLAMAIDFAMPIYHKFEEIYPQVNAFYKGDYRYVVSSSFFWGACAAHEFILDRDNLMNTDLITHFRDTYRMPALGYIDDVFNFFLVRHDDKIKDSMVTFACYVSRLAEGIFQEDYHVTNPDEWMDAASGTLFLFGAMHSFRRFGEEPSRSCPIFYSTLRMLQQLAKPMRLDKRILIEEPMPNPSPKQTYTIKQRYVQGADGKPHLFTEVYDGPLVNVDVTKEYTEQDIEEIKQQMLRRSECREDDWYDAFAIYWMTGDWKYFRDFCTEDVTLRFVKPKTGEIYGGFEFIHESYFKKRLDYHKAQNIRFRVFLAGREHDAKYRIFLCRFATGGEGYQFAFEYGKVKHITQFNNFMAGDKYYDYFQRPDTSE